MMSNYKLLTAAQPVNLVQVCQRTESLSLITSQGVGVEASKRASQQVTVSSNNEALFYAGDR